MGRWCMLVYVPHATGQTLKPWWNDDFLGEFHVKSCKSLVLLPQRWPRSRLYRFGISGRAFCRGVATTVARREKHTFHRSLLWKKKQQNSVERHTDFACLTPFWTDVYLEDQLHFPHFSWFGYILTFNDLIMVNPRPSAQTCVFLPLLPDEVDISPS